MNLLVSSYPQPAFLSYAFCYSSPPPKKIKQVHVAFNFKLSPNLNTIYPDHCLMENVNSTCDNKDGNWCCMQQTMLIWTMLKSGFTFVLKHTSFFFLIIHHYHDIHMEMFVNMTRLLSNREASVSDYDDGGDNTGWTRTMAQPSGFWQTGK